MASFSLLLLFIKTETATTHRNTCSFPFDCFRNFFTVFVINSFSFGIYSFSAVNRTAYTRCLNIPYIETQSKKPQKVSHIFRTSIDALLNRTNVARETSISF